MTSEITIEQLELMTSSEAFESFRKSYDDAWNSEFIMDKVLKLWYDKSSINDAVVNCRCYYSNFNEENEKIYWNVDCQYIKESNEYEYKNISGNTATEINDGLDSRLVNFQIYYDFYEELNKRSIKELDSTISNDPELKNDLNLTSRIERSKRLLEAINTLISNFPRNDVQNLELTKKKLKLNDILINIRHNVNEYLKKKSQNELYVLQEESKINQLQLNSIKLNYYKSKLKNTSDEITKKTTAVYALKCYYELIYYQLAEVDEFALKEAEYQIVRAEDELYDSLTKHTEDERQKYIINKYQLKELLTNQLNDMNSKIQTQEEEKKNAETLIEEISIEEKRTAVITAYDTVTAAKEACKKLSDRPSDRYIYQDSDPELAQKSDPEFILDIKKIQAKQTLSDANETFNQAKETLDQVEQTLHITIFNKSKLEVRLAEVEYRLAKAQVSEADAQLSEAKNEMKIFMEDSNMMVNFGILGYKIECMRLHKCSIVANEKFTSASEKLKVLQENFNYEAHDFTIDEFINQLTLNDDPSTIQSAENDSWPGHRMGLGMTLGKGAFDIAKKLF